MDPLGDGGERMGCLDHSFSTLLLHRGSRVHGVGISTTTSNAPPPRLLLLLLRLLLLLLLRRRLLLVDTAATSKHQKQATPETALNPASLQEPSTQHLKSRTHHRPLLPKKDKHNNKENDETNNNHTIPKPLNPRNVPTKNT